MNNEIKEILKDIDNEECYYAGINGCLYQDLDKEQLLCIKNYITNLQQENQELKKKLDRRYYKNEYERIKEENERLKQTQVFIDTQDMEERYGEELYKDYLKEQLDDYKSRCEKAIEYINNFSVDKNFSFPLMKRWEENQVKASIDYEFNDTLKKDLLNILQNGSEENVSDRD